MPEYNDDQSQHDGPHFGLILALVTHGLAISEYPEMVRVANIAESYGFGSVWLCDHFLTLSPDDYAQDAGIGGDGQRQEAAGVDAFTRGMDSAERARPRHDKYPPRDQRAV